METLTAIIFAYIIGFLTGLKMRTKILDLLIK
jgi:hypothetical protein